MEVPGLLTLSGGPKTEKINGWFCVCLWGRENIAQMVRMVGKISQNHGQWKEMREQRLQSHEKDSNLSPLAPAGLIRVGCQVPACGLWSALTMFLSAQKAILEGLVGMVGISVPKKKQLLTQIMQQRQTHNCPTCPVFLGHPPVHSSTGASPFRPCPRCAGPKAGQESTTVSLCRGSKKR